jgi:capsid protein
MFVRVLIREIARCLDIPLSIALGDASDSNYSSARMEHLRYHRRIGVDRATLETHGLEKIFSAWYAEARLVGLTTPGYLPRDLPPVLPPHRWLWPRTHSIDPVKDATADQIELKNGTTTLAAIYASRGEDWEEALEQQGREAEKRKELGLVLTPAKELDKAMAAAARALVRRENRRKRVHLNGSANGSR